MIFTDQHNCLARAVSVPRDLDVYEVWLLVDGETLYPFSSHGFRVAQGSLRSVIARSRDNLFLNSGGEIFRIRSIEPHRNALTARARRFLGGAYGIDVELERQILDLSELKEIVIAGLARYRAEADDDESWTFAALPMEEARSAISSARTPKHLFTILDLPSAPDCLDLL